MNIKTFYILTLIIIAAACSGNSRKDENKNTIPALTFQTSSVYKNAEFVKENQWKLIFRKLDDCQYIVFLTDTVKINTLKDTLIIPSGNSYTTNPDFINFRFNIEYTEDSVIDPVTGENTIINKIIDISRSQSSRFYDAGFTDDTEADNFIINLKKYVKIDSAFEISKMIFYPQYAVINKKKLKLSDPEIFINNYSRIFNQKIKNAIINQTLADIKSGSKGLVLGTDNIRISRVDNKIYITSINN